MYPPLLFFYPDIAKSLIEYRFNHLEASKAKALGYNYCNENSSLVFDCVIWPPDEELFKSLSFQQQYNYRKFVNKLKTEIINENDIIEIPFHNQFINESLKQNTNSFGDCNYKGALFAWEAGFTGAEVCPCMAGGTCLHEHHISGDIAFAVYQYWISNHDLHWLETIGYPLAKEIALFWESRVVFNGKQYEILNTIPPDEAAMGVNNSVFTNIIAQYSFSIANEFASILSLPTSSNWEKIEKYKNFLYFISFYSFFIFLF